MYELEIRDVENKAVKNYSAEGTFISDILVEENLVTINRVVKNEDVYHATSPDYITNNEERYHIFSSRISMKRRISWCEKSKSP